MPVVFLQKAVAHGFGGLAEGCVICSGSLLALRNRIAFINSEMMLSLRAMKHRCCNLPFVLTREAAINENANATTRWNEMRDLIMARDGVGIFHLPPGLEIDIGVLAELREGLESHGWDLELLLCSGKFVLPP